jgi:Holliday junction DNA helicase RuvA
MISQLKGLVLEKSPPHLVLDVGGVGYAVDVSMHTFYQLANIGQEQTLYTHLSIREDAHVLFGFFDRAERETFRQLIKISGVGPKIALGILSGLTSAELGLAIETADIKKLSAAPGIGKKTAERLIVELRGKILSDHIALFDSAAAPEVDYKSDIIAALMSLGYNEKEARNATKSLTQETSVSEGVRLALRQLM